MKTSLLGLGTPESLTFLTLSSYGSCLNSHLCRKTNFGGKLSNALILYVIRDHFIDMFL